MDQMVQSERVLCWWERRGQNDNQALELPTSLVIPIKTSQACKIYSSLNWLEQIKAETWSGRYHFLSTHYVPCIKPVNPKGNQS